MFSFNDDDKNFYWIIFPLNEEDSWDEEKINDKVAIISFHFNNWNTNNYEHWYQITGIWIKYLNWSKKIEISKLKNPYVNLIQ